MYFGLKLYIMKEKQDREKYLKQNPVSMKEIDDAIENYRSEGEVK